MRQDFAVVPFIRVYRDRSDYGTWHGNPDIARMIVAAVLIVTGLGVAVLADGACRVRLLEEGRDQAALLGELRGRGILPHGRPGEGVLADARAGVEEFLATIAPTEELGMMGLAGAAAAAGGAMMMMSDERAKTKASRSVHRDWLNAEIEKRFELLTVTFVANCFVVEILHLAGKDLG